MQRREFMSLLAGAAVWPNIALAEAAKRVRRVGVLMGYVESDPVAQARVMAFRQGLRDLGWIEGGNVQLDYRWPGDDPGRIRAHAAEIAQLAPEVVLSAPAQVTLELDRATKSLPIVFANVADPIAVGLVKSISRPGGNMTGFANFEYTLAGKWLDVLREMIPSATRIGVFYSRENPASRGRLRVIEDAAPSQGVQVVGIGVSEATEIEPAFNAFAQQRIGALILLPSIFLANHRSGILVLAAKHQFPAVYPFRYFVADGGLLSYGVDMTDQFRQAAGYVDRILKGEKPGDLPVQNPIKFELTINLKTAKALGLAVPPTLLARADEVIE